MLLLPPFIFLHPATRLLASDLHDRRPAVEASSRRSAGCRRPVSDGTASGSPCGCRSLSYPFDTGPPRPARTFQQRTIAFRCIRRRPVMQPLRRACARRPARSRGMTVTATARTAMGGRRQSHGLRPSSPAPDAGGIAQDVQGGCRVAAARKLLHAAHPGCGVEDEPAVCRVGVRVVEGVEGLVGRDDQLEGSPLTRRSR